MALALVFGTYSMQSTTDSPRCHTRKLKKVDRSPYFEKFTGTRRLAMGCATWGEKLKRQNTARPATPSPRPHRRGDHVKSYLDQYWPNIVFRPHQRGGDRRLQTKKYEGRQRKTRTDEDRQRKTKKDKERQGHPKTGGARQRQTKKGNGR